MSKHLADLLGNDHPLFRHNLKELERASGNAGIDARLLADCVEQAHQVMRSIGLDPADSSAEEIYHALSACNSRDDAKSLFTQTSYVLLIKDDNLISFNYYDIVENAHHELTFEDRKIDHAQRRLRMEIVKRYAEHESTHVDTVHQLTREANIHMDQDSHYSDVDAALQGNVAEKKSPYILAIGDIFTDAFITLGDETAKIIKEGDAEWLAVPFGRKPPYEKVDIVKSVGPSPNVAVSIARLGYNAGLMAWVGGDATGKEAIEHLQTEQVGIESMIIEEDKATSYWYVLCYKADRTMLVKSEKYRYEWKDPVTKPEWIYLAYLGEDSWPLHEGLLDYLDRNPDIKLVLQPGTFHFSWDAERMAPLYRRSHVTLMNREEAMDVTGRGYDSIKQLADGLHDMGPEIVVITDGPNGSYVSHADTVFTIPNYPDPAPPVERTGAGDAFSSTFVAAIAAGESIETALSWAPINSASVVQQIGAQAGLLSFAELQEWLEKAPEDYKVTQHTD